MRRWSLVAGYTGALYLAVPFARVVVDALRAHGALTGTIMALTVAAVAATLLLARRRRGGGETGRRGGWAWAAAAAAGLAVWASSLEVLEERVHLVQYSFLAVLVQRAEPRVFRAFLITVALGAGDEALQALVPSRVFDWRDVGFNTGAAALGTILAAAISPRSSAPRVGSEDSAARPAP